MMHLTTVCMVMLSTLFAYLSSPIDRGMYKTLHILNRRYRRAATLSRENNR